MSLCINSIMHARANINYCGFNIHVDRQLRWVFAKHYMTSLLNWYHHFCDFTYACFSNSKLSFFFKTTNLILITFCRVSLLGAKNSQSSVSFFVLKSNLLRYKKFVVCIRRFQLCRPIGEINNIKLCL